ncbi:MAG: lipopolysaccharide biosynthesis protein [Gammaproteobacteria bacterium]|nr:MAG: lipopolysaccharide biosynthesis protein [Gammaproteobacteria bacterium]
MNNRARAIALYLPQFHPIPENDKWWGAGFTEWTNTAKAKPMFRGHYQPHIPADLGFYDLRLEETRIAQAELARSAGIEGFCYYHYWFAGKMLLDRPFREVLELKTPDFPFCLCWANETWSGIWHGESSRILIEQTYPGHSDYLAHFKYLLPAFSDDRYIKVDGKPLFFVYRPLGIPDLDRFVDTFRELAHQAGLKGLFLVGRNPDPWWNPQAHGFDASNTALMPQLRPWVSKRKPFKWAKRHYDEFIGHPTIYTYEDAMLQLIPEKIKGIENFPNVIPNWDNTPRSGSNGLVLHHSTPELFQKHLKSILEFVADKPLEHRVVFIKSWNEWAEGNYLEPDLRFGHSFLNVVREQLLGIPNSTQLSSEAL